MDEKEIQKGYNVARGAIRYITKIGCIYIAIILALSLLRTLFGFGIDDSDKDTWHRSGVTVITDYKTGIQYLSDGHGGMVQRGVISK